MNSLMGKTVLVTGGSTRIGRQISLAAAKEGANVVVHYARSESLASKTVQDIHAFGVSAWHIQQDFGKKEEIVGFLLRCLEISSIDILVNNAAIFEPLLLQTTSLEQWEQHFAINLTAPFLLSKTFASELNQDRQGRIINLLDWRAFRPGIDHFPYTISKSALGALTKSLACALAPNIVVNGLALGAILPPSNGGENDILKDIPAKRWADLNEIEEAFLFLATGPTYITGEIIHLDGGRHLV